MSSVIYVIIYLKNTREKHSIENKPPQTTAFRESLLVQHYKTISNDCFVLFFLFCAGQLLRIIAHGMSGQEELVRH